jgi:hypothetical protein
MNASQANQEKSFETLFTSYSQFYYPESKKGRRDMKSAPI